MSVLRGVPDSLLNDPARWADHYTPDLRAADRSEMRRLHRAAMESRATSSTVITPVDTTAAAGNEMRPERFAQIVGQRKAKALLARMVVTAKERGEPLDHVLLVGPSGTGKTTFAHVLATELQSQVWQLEAPISADALLELAGSMQRGDILFLDEIHQQAVGDRRGRSSSTQPEILFSVMEDFTLPTGSGVLPFPRVTIMGATTDEGALPDAFINRFPIRPRLERYTPADMGRIAAFSAQRKGLKLTPRAAHIFGHASRGVPREVNNFIRNAAMLTSHEVDSTLATEVVCELNGYTLDGLTPDHQAMLLFLLHRPNHQASISNIATAIGKSRDVKAVQLRVEPHLIERNYIDVLSRGRALTPSGVERARELTP